MARLSTSPTPHHHIVQALVLITALVGFGGVVSAQAAVTGPLAKAVAQGKQIFLHDTFGGQGRTCSACHQGAGLAATVTPKGSRFPNLSNAAAIFPRYSARAGRVITLQEQIRGCVKGALGGTPPAYGSLTMRALVSYLTSLSQGKPIDMGGKLR